MKTLHIIIIIVLFIVVAVVVSTFTDAGTYSTFSEAAGHPEKDFSIIGKLNKTKPVEYNAEKDPNKFTFFMSDEEGTERQVICNKAKPQDFEKSDQVVIIGYAEGDHFIARNLLLKCPSKYNAKKIPEEFGKKKF